MRTTHGMTHSMIYSRWAGMLQRCTNPNSSGYKDYGGRGIKVCTRWAKFENFLADMGVPSDPKMQLDRFPNTDGDYEPGNVRWATTMQQSDNKTRTRKLTFDGKTMTIREWGELGPIPRWLIHQRLSKGWSVSDALTTERNFNERRLEFEGKSLPLAEWAKIKGLKLATLYFRLRRGWSVERALTEKTI